MNMFNQVLPALLASRHFRPVCLACSLATLLCLPFAAPAQSAPPKPPGEQSPLTCVVCGKSPLTGQVWRHKTLGHVFCDECHQLKTRCSHCGLPARDGFAKTSDGRVFCRLDLPNVVLSTNDAVRVFHETKADLLRLTGDALALKQPHVSVTLSDVAYWSGNESASDLHRVGIAHSRLNGGQFSHNVVLLSGQPKDDLRSVCAHEYTHLWINENRPEGRVIDPSTLEAICELAAYKLAQSRRDTNQIERLRRNPYTQGLITNLITFESHNGFEAVLAWVKTGRTPKLDVDSAGATRTAAWAVPSVQRALPEEVTLTGLAVSATRRVAFINGVLFAASDRKRVRLKDRTVIVKCVEIREDGVLVQVEGEAQPRALKLEGK